MRIATLPSIVSKLLGDTPVGARLVIAGVIPVVAFLYLAISGLAEAVAQRREAVQIRTASTMMPPILRLIDELQRGRGLTVLAVSADTDAARQDAAAQGAAIDRELSALEAKAGALTAGDIGEAAYRAWQRVFAIETQLAKVRREMEERALTAAHAIATYDRMIGGLAEIFHRVLGTQDNPGMTRQLTVLIAVAEAKDRARLERAAGARGFATSRFPAAVHEEFARFHGEQDGYLRMAAQFSTGAVREALLRFETSAETRQVEEMRALALRALNSPIATPETTGDWFDRAGARIAGLARIEMQIAQQLGADAGSIAAVAADRARNLAILTAVLFAVLGLALFVVIRSITKPIGELIAEAGRLAQGDTSVKFQSAARKDEIGAVAGAVAQFRDNVIEQRRTSEDFAQAIEDLREANEALQRFTSIAAHDLGAPLKRIEAFIAALREDYAQVLEGEGADILVRIERGVGRMRLMLDSLLEYSKFNGRSIEGRTANLGGVISGALESFDLATIGAQVRIELNGFSHVQGDPTLLTHVMQNLFGNAIKFRGAAPLDIHIGAASVGGVIQFFIADNGIGVEPRFAERVFQMFYRLHGEDEYAGTGIGLTVCKKIINDHGGTIWLDTGYTRGTRIVFTLKPADAALPGQEPEQSDALPEYPVAIGLLEHAHEPRRAA